MNYLVGDIGNTSTRVCVLNNKHLIIQSLTFDTKKLFKKKYFNKSFSKILTRKLNSNVLFSCVVPSLFKIIKRNFRNTKYKIVEIKDLNKIKLIDDEFCYHAGTVKKDKKIYAVGGRVLNFVCQSESFLEARTRIIDLINSLNWKNGFFRKDIGYKAIDE